MDDRFPHVPEALLTALEKLFPEKSPRTNESYSDLMVRAGHAEVISFLRMKFEGQNNNLLR